MASRNPLIEALMTVTGNNKPKAAQPKKKEMKGGLFGKAKDGIKNRTKKIDAAIKKSGG